MFRRIQFTSHILYFVKVNLNLGKSRLTKSRSKILVEDENFCVIAHMIDVFMSSLVLLVRSDKLVKSSQTKMKIKRCRAAVNIPTDRSAAAPDNSAKSLPNNTK